MSKLTYIYTLKDPNTNLVRYVGKTILKPEYRFKQHINAAKIPKTHKDYWINKLIRENKIPVLEIIDETTGDWVTMEQSYIRLFKAVGGKLCNHSIGGEGAFGVKRTLAQRAFQSKFMKTHCENWVINKISREENINHLTNVRKKSTEVLSKPVYEYNGDGKIINVFSSCNELSRILKIPRRSLQTTLNRNREFVAHTCNKRLFSRDKNGTVKILSRKKPYTSLKIKILNIETNIITEYASVNEFIKIINKNIEYKTLKKFESEGTIFLSTYKVTEFNYNK